MSKSQADKVYARIKADIISHAIKPGEQIVNAQLVERYQVGTTPVREALQRLTQDRFVQPIPRFGYIVSPITVNYLQEMFELRAVLEVAAARLAAERASDEDLVVISDLAELNMADDETDDPRVAFLNADAQFHHAIANAAGNTRLTEMISRQLDEMTRVMYNAITWKKDSPSHRISAHVELAQALRDRDPDRAEQISREMVARSLQIALEAYAPHFHGTPSRK